jgi:Tfp pilus assembly protein PilF
MAFAALVASMLGSSPAFAGYDHYWTWKRMPRPAAVHAAIADMQRIAAARPDLVVSEMTDDGISINGIGERAHESFDFPGRTPDLGVPPGVTPGFNACKTQWKPYDAAITASLLAARDHFGFDVLEIKSDGDWEAWAPGRSIYHSVFGRDAKQPFEQGAMRGVLAWTGLDSLLMRGGTFGTLMLGVLFYMMFFRDRGSRSVGGGWGSYYLFWLVAPTVLAIATAHPFLLVLAVVGWLARRWLPDPYLFFKYGGRARQLAAEIAANPENITARRNLAMIWLEKRRPRRAEPHLERALARDPESIELLYLMGICQLGLKKYERAVDAFVRTVQKDPRHRYGDPYLRAADALMALRRWDDAEDAIEHFHEINESSVEAPYKLARVKAARGDREGARSALAAARQAYRGLPRYHRQKEFPWYVRSFFGA